MELARNLCNSQYKCLDNLAPLASPHLCRAADVGENKKLNVSGACERRERNGMVELPAVNQRALYPYHSLPICFALEGRLELESSLEYMCNKTTAGII